MYYTKDEYMDLHLSLNGAPMMDLAYGMDTEDKYLKRLRCSMESGDEKALEFYDVLYGPLEHAPQHINSSEWIVVGVARWRLGRGK